MAISSRETGWSNKENLLWQISKYMERLAAKIGSIFVLTQNQQDAITGANSPSASNVFATMADVPVSPFTKDKMSAAKKGKSFKNAGQFKKGLIPSNKGTAKVGSYRYRELNGDVKRRGSITTEMIESVKSGISKRKFNDRFGYWNI